MDHQAADQREKDWVEGFEGMEEREILAMRLPAELSNEECFRFRSLQEDAAKVARERRQLALLRDAEKDLSVTAGLHGAIKTAPPALAEAEPIPLAAPAPHALPFAIPTGRTDALLDRQIASCAGIIEHLAHYIARYDTSVEVCNKFMDRITGMMKSSAEAAIAAGRLRGMAPEGRRRA